MHHVAPTFRKSATFLAHKDIQPYRSDYRASKEGQGRAGRHAEHARGQAKKACRAKNPFTITFWSTPRIRPAFAAPFLRVPPCTLCVLCG